MPPRSSVDPSQSVNRKLNLKKFRLQNLNSVLNREKQREYNSLVKSSTSQIVFIIFMLVSMCYFYMILRKMEENDKSLLKTSYYEIIQTIRVQSSKSMETIPMRCIFVISLFNLISLIICQINFPCPKPLFVTLLLQALLGCISILIPDFLLFIIFFWTSWSVPTSLNYCANRRINEYRDKNSNR